MSCSFKLGLPTDIPWKRICVSEDMLDPIPCDQSRPPKWESSIAVFRYDPDEEYQLYKDYIISYLKVVVTVVSFAPDISCDRIKTVASAVLIDNLEEAFPCYGALLQITVTPIKTDSKKYSKENYPFFIEFEPKKRELYESVTDTGEVLSGSSSSLSVGKSAITSDSTENFNLDTGWNFGLDASYTGNKKKGKGTDLGAEAKLGASASYKIGTTGSSGLQNTNLRTTDESTERRERQSHTTQLSQMYNLFQAFHLGTNRALFFMEPRPHIRQSEATFINGPRALEGIQEIFLTVVRPKEMKDFCIGNLLETAHLSKRPVYEYETKTATLNFRLYAKAQNMDTSSGKTDWTETKRHTETYTVPSGWEIDTPKGQGGYTYKILRKQRVRSGPTFGWRILFFLMAYIQSITMTMRTEYCVSIIKTLQEYLWSRRDTVMAGITEGEFSS